MPNTLIIRLDGQDHIFDLHGQDSRLEIASGYYEAAYLQRTAKDLLLELARTGDRDTASITIPLFWQERFEAELGYMTPTVEKIVLTDKELGSISRPSCTSGATTLDRWSGSAWPTPA